MELILLNMVAFLRPLASIEQVAPLFEVSAMALFAVLAGAFFMKAATRKIVHFSAVDAFIVAFVVWCLATSVIYFDAVRLPEVAKLILPLLGYTIAKNVFRGRRDYRMFLFVALAGFALPLVGSAVVIAAGSPVALDMVNYWTGVARWEGLYEHSHVLAHSAALSLMARTLYAVTLRGGSGEATRTGRAEATFLLLVALAAVFCLYMSQVRTAILGLLVFAAAYLAFQNRRLLVLGGIAGAVLALVTLPYWYSALLPELAATDPREELDLERLGSGRPTFWLNDLVIFANLPLDRQLAGVGIGARGEYSVTEEEIMGHSDWLELLTQTGIVGFLLFGAIQVAILRKLLRMPSPERWGYVALFVAVNLMMLVSNSYAWRIQVSQIYYMMLAFVELPQAVAVARIAPPELSTAGRAWR